MSSRGELGGLSAAAPRAADLFSAIGFDDVLVETVGVGQNEIAVMRLADTVLVVLAPGMGDGIQAAKAGILEIADMLVVNKSDHDGAAATVRDLKGDGRAGPVRKRGRRGTGGCRCCPPRPAPPASGSTNCWLRWTRTAMHLAGTRAARPTGGSNGPRWRCRRWCWSGSQAALQSAAGGNWLAAAADGSPADRHRPSACGRLRGAAPGWPRKP